MNNWKKTVDHLTAEFMRWGCPFSRKQLPEIAMSYDCSSLFFWNWLDDPETEKTERGFLRVLGYAWRKYLQEEMPGEEAEPVPAEEEFPAPEAA